jgi:hypothetical protein
MRFWLVAVLVGVASVAHANPADPLATEPPASSAARAPLDALMQESDKQYASAIAPAIAQVRAKVAALDEQLQRAIKENPLPEQSTADAHAKLREQLDKLRAQQESSQAARLQALEAAAAAAKLAAGKPSSVEGAIVEGVLKFVERRAREEAVRYVVRRLDSHLCGRGSKSGALLPNTCGLLETVGKSSDGVAPLELLRQSIRADLRALPRTLGAYVEADASLHELACGLRIGAALGHAVQHATSAPDVADDIIDALDASCGIDSRFVLTARVALSALHDACSDSYECNAHDVRDTARQALAERAPAASAELVEYDALVQRLVGELDQVINEPRAAEALRTEATRIAGELAAARAIVDSARASALTAYNEARDAAIAPVQALVERLAPAMTDLERVTADLSRAEKADRDSIRDAALAASGDLIASMLAKRQPHAEALARLAIAAAQFPRGEYTSGMAGLLGSGMLPANREPYRTLVAFAELLSGLSNASSSEEVAALIEAAAPPTGSWEQKRRRLTVGLSAQFGMAGGVGWTQGGGTSGGEIAAFIPIGLDLARPIRGIGAGGAMIEILDLGAISSTRLESDAMVQQQANVTLSSVFAPGAMLYLGIGHTPFTVSLAGSYVPTLRKLADDSAVGELRLQLGLSVDVPLFAF